ncbi:MAG: class I SAM-dependent methyltransferase [Desulfobacteraceae bacterium]|nr:class I SAM-dependent methyltransferase [Desulfobacteraceae bacterium]
MLIGNEKVILDFGCGTGRFTPDLAKIINGKAIGIDPIRYLIDMAPKIINVEYLLCKEGQIPLPENSVDVVWSCLVLGGINGKSLNKSIEEIDRVLKTGGLLFIVENTSEKKDGEFWFFRQFTDYKKFFHLWH